MKYSRTELLSVRYKIKIKDELNSLDLKILEYALKELLKKALRKPIN